MVKKSKSYYFVLYNIFSFRGKYYAQYRIYIYYMCIIKSYHNVNRAFLLFEC